MKDIMEIDHDSMSNATPNQKMAKAFDEEDIISQQVVLRPKKEVSSDGERETFPKDPTGRVESMRVSLKYTG
jgi:hypothetical protein